MTHQRRRHLNLRHAQGQTVSEYAILLALIFLVVVAVIPLFGASVTGLFTKTLTQFSAVFGG
jgi:Flp pilus assembly pilin Flp